jgi:L-alanine-DL-glutamate epimerase-like enolase superfamily enzyme
MADGPIITGIETIQFEWIDPRRGAKAHPSLPHATAIRVTTGLGVTGEYVGGWPPDHDAVAYFAHVLIGRSALDRLTAYELCKHLTRQSGRVGYSVVDVALWDLAGKWFDAPVYRLLGAERRRLPCYASTTIGDDDPAVLGSARAYADFAERCFDIGYPAFKIHGWLGGDVQKEIDIAAEVGERVGDRMTLMDDVSSALKTLGDAIRLGRVLDDYRYFWYEDPYADTGISASGNGRLREKVRTPLLITEHLRSLEPKVDFFLAGGTDLLRADPDFDGGITGAMKIAHAAEGLGTDVELHFAGPAHRHCMTAIRNTNYYEMGLVHPDYDITSPASGVALNYRDGLEAVDTDGCVLAPDGAGLGVEYDWDLVEARRVGGRKWGSW